MTRYNTSPSLLDAKNLRESAPVVIRYLQEQEGKNWGNFLAHSKEAGIGLYLVHRHHELTYGHIMLEQGGPLPAKKGNMLLQQNPQK